MKKSKLPNKLQWLESILEYRFLKHFVWVSDLSMKIVMNTNYAGKEIKFHENKKEV